MRPGFTFCAARCKERLFGGAGEGVVPPQRVYTALVSSSGVGKEWSLSSPLYSGEGDLLMRRRVLLIMVAMGLGMLLLEEAGWPWPIL